MKSLLFAIASFLATLCFLPVISTFRVGIPPQPVRYFSNIPLWSLSQHDSICWGMLSLWWLGIVLVAGGIYLLWSKA